MGLCAFCLRWSVLLLPRMLAWVLSTRQFSILLWGFPSFHRSLPLFRLQDALWDLLGSHHYVLANTVTPALGALFQGIAECLMTPRSWHCGFHALIIHCHCCPVKWVPLLPFLSKRETDTFQLQAWVNPDNYSEVQTWLSYLVVCHLRLSSLVFFIRGPWFFSSGEWGMQTSLPLCSVYPRHTRNTLCAV